MKKLNVQRDLDSRSRIAEATLLPALPEPIVEPQNTKTDAKSENSQECTNNQSTSFPAGKKAKGRRAATGNIQKI